MSFDWKSIITAVLTALAAQGGWIGAIAALIAQYVLPLIGSDETLTVPEAESAPPEFKQSVRDFLLGLVGKVQRPLIRLLLTQVVGAISDAILDAVWDMLVGKSPAISAESVSDELAAASVEFITG